MIQRVLPSPPHRDAASPRTRARGLLALLGLAVAALLMLAAPATACAARAGPGCVAAAIEVVAEAGSAAGPRASGRAAGVRASEVEATVDATAAEFGLPRAASDIVRTDRPGRVAHAAVPVVAPASIVDGSPHRPPRAA